jgi:ubiquinone/menaquinone biosynthesis C-methylase UbiE
MIQPRKSERSAILREYARMAPEYDARWSFYVRATARETLKRLPRRPIEAILDVGCGTGALLAQLAVAYPHARLAGVDASNEMLTIARQQVPTTIELKQGWAEELPFADKTFDLVLSCNTFHYIRQPEAALQEMVRVLRPDGLLIITDWCDDYLACKLCDWYLRYTDPAHFRTYGVRQCQTLLRGANTNAIQIERYKISWLWGLMTAIAQKSLQNLV